MNNREVTVGSHTWAFEFGDHRETVIRIRMGDRFLVFPITEGRKVSDLIHDLCDRHESAQRAKHANQ